MVATVKFEAAFGIAPGVVPTTNDWVDLSDRLGDPVGVVWSYGRQTELDRVEAGTGTVTLDNTDRELEPVYSGSSYHPDVRPMVRVRCTAEFSASTYSVFEGFVEAWQPTWVHPADGWVTLPVVDGLKLLALARTSASYSEQKSGARIGALLDAASWPAGNRDLDTGQSDVQAYTASDRNVLNAIRDAAEAEDGVFFIAPDGDATFYDRYSRVVAESQATFGDGSGELPYADLQVSYDDTVLWNDVSVTRDGGSVQRADSPSSITTYGRRWLDKDGLIITSDSEADDLANWLIRRYRNPRLRVEAITLEGHQDDSVMTQILTRTIGDRITVKRRPPGGGAAIEFDAFIERVEHRVRGVEWVTSWRLSPAFDETVWLLGTAGFSELGDTTALGY